MDILVDVVHPADVHFYRYVITELRAHGCEVTVLARRKDATVALLEAFGIDHDVTGSSRHASRWRQGLELLGRDAALVRIARRGKVRAILTRNPAGTHAARLTAAVSIFDTDDGTAAGIHFRLAAPFAHLVTTPDCMPENYGTKHLKYPGYKALAYLHPQRFQPDPSVRAELGLGLGEPYHIVRFVEMVASHDHGESGMPNAAKRQAIAQLSKVGRVFISSEGTLPPDLQPLAFPLAPTRLHDALAFATTYVGDSQTMAEEAGVLGVPSLRCTSWTGRLHYLNQLERRYGLVESFHPTDSAQFLRRVEQIAAGDDRQGRMERRAKMLDEKIDVTGWYRDLVLRVLDGVPVT